MPPTEYTCTSCCCISILNTIVYCWGRVVFRNGRCKEPHKRQVSFCLTKDPPWVYGLFFMLGWCCAEWDYIEVPCWSLAVYNIDAIVYNGTWCYIGELCCPWWSVAWNTINTYVLVFDVRRRIATQGMKKPATGTWIVFRVGTSVIRYEYRHGPLHRSLHKAVDSR